MFSLGQQRAIAALANANPKDDRQLAERLLEYGLAFEAFDMLNGKPVVPADWVTTSFDWVTIFATKAREMLPELHVLLRSLATNCGRSRAKQIVAKHEGQGHVVGSVVRREFDGSKGEETRGTFEQFIEAVPRRPKMRRRSPIRQSFDCSYADLLDPICQEWKPGLGPFGICKFRPRHFFALEFFGQRGRPAELCSEHRKSKYDRSRKACAVYMFGHRWRARGRRAIRKQIKTLLQRKPTPKRKRHLTILRALLNRRPGVDSSVHTKRNYVH